MKTFYYSVKAANDEKPNAGIVEADDEQAALVKLDGVYGNTDDHKVVDINILTQNEFDLLQAERGKRLTHRPE